MPTINYTYNGYIVTTYNGYIATNYNGYIATNSSVTTTVGNSHITSYDEWCFEPLFQQEEKKAIYKQEEMEF